MGHHQGMTLSRAALTVLSLAVVAVFGWFFRRAIQSGRMQYGNAFGRRLYVSRDQHPRLFWLAFLPGGLFCVWMTVLAIRGLGALAG